MDPSEAFRVGQSLAVVVIGRSFPKPPRAPSSSAPEEEEVEGGKGKGKGRRKANLTSVFLGLDISSDVSEVVRLMRGTDGANESVAENVVSGTVFKEEEDGQTLSVRLDDGREAKMLKSHIADFAETSQALMAFHRGGTDGRTGSLFDKRFGVGQRIEKAVFMSSAGGTIYISAKPLLVSSLEQSLQQQLRRHAENPPSHYENNENYIPPPSNSSSSDGNNKGENLEKEREEVSVPMHIGDLTPGQVVVGYVHKVESFGVIVRFRGTLSALAPRPNIADKFVSAPEKLFSVGDSMRCVVQRVDLSTERVFVTFKPSIVRPSARQFNYLRALLKERYLVADMQISESKKIMPAWRTYGIGEVVPATVTSIEEFGIVMLAEDNVTIMLAKNVQKDKNNNNNKSLQVGDRTEVMVLDIDYAVCLIEVTLDKSLFIRNPIVRESQKSTAKKNKSSKKSNIPIESSAESSQEGSKKPLLSEGEEVSATILAIKDKYLIVSTVSKSNQLGLGYVMVADYHCPCPDLTVFSVGGALQLKVIHCGSDANTFPHDRTVLFTELQQDLSTSITRKTLSSLQKAAKEADLLTHKRLQDGQVDTPSSHHAFKVGQVDKWVVSSISPTELTVTQQNRPALTPVKLARVHLSNAVHPEASNDNLSSVLLASKSQKAFKQKGISALHPFAGLQIGSVIICRLLQIRKSSDADNDNTISLYLSLIRKEEENETDNNNNKNENNDKENTEASRSFMIQATGKHTLRRWSVYPAVVIKVESDRCLVSFSPYQTAYLSFIDVSNKIKLIKKFQKFCFVGLRVTVMVTDIQKCEENGQKFPRIRVSRAIIEHLLSRDGLSSKDFSNLSEV